MKTRFIKDLIMASVFYAYAIALFAIFWYATGLTEMGVIFIPAIIFCIVLACFTYTRLYQEYRLEVKLVTEFQTKIEGLKNLSIAEDLVKNREEANDILYSVRLHKLLCEPIKERLKMLSEQEESEGEE